MFRLRLQARCRGTSRGECSLGAPSDWVIRGVHVAPFRPPGFADVLMSVAVLVAVKVSNSSVGGVF